jgi:4-alpha-glucanotransferase
MISALDSMARRHGIVRSYTGPGGKPMAVSDEVCRHLLGALGVDPEDYDGMDGAPDAPADTRTSPERPCYFPDWLRARRAWGISTLLYELRSDRNWGIGDFEDLARLCEQSAKAGAHFVGLNPLHALFLAEPDRCSPFSPSNRKFLNPLYIAVDLLAGFEPGMADEQELRRLRLQDFVDYAGVAKVKLDVLGRIWRQRQAADGEALRDFEAEAGEALRHHALFEALSLQMKAEGRGSGWKDWPAAFARPDGAAVPAFAQTNADEVDFQIWLQWLARGQLGEAARRARAAGMKIGLYLDFAVGEAPDGSAAWSEPELTAGSVKIGAPPDVFSTTGQDWGLAPLSPRKLSEGNFADFRTIIDAVTQDAGALRIDHAMSLQQLFWIPENGIAADGGFVLYPTGGLLRTLAEVSLRKETIVIGEDLGHVPEGFRELMACAGIFSYRILYFEQARGRYRPARTWPALALACLSTHDLPTLRGWWVGSDVELRLEHGLIGRDAAARQRRARRLERRGMLRAFAGSAVLGRAARRSLQESELGDQASVEALTVAAYRFIARTPSRLVALRLADAVGEEHPTNLPGTAEGYPNWRRKLSVRLEDISAHPLFRSVTAALGKERPS